MAGEVSAQLELIRRVREGQNDPNFRELLIMYLEKAADDLEDVASSADDSADLLDRAGLTPTVAMTTGAIAAIVTTGGAAMPIVVLAGSVVILGALGVGRTTLRSKSRRQRAGARKLRGLAERLRTNR
jgi:hypothetical protein